MLDLLTVLQRGRDYLRETETNRCPLCQQEIEARTLLSRLVKRVAELEEVNLHQQRLARARDDLEVALHDAAGRLRTLEQTQAGVSRAGISRVGVVARGTATADLENAISMLRESVRTGAPVESMEMAGRVADALTRWEAWSRETMAALTSVEEAEPEEDGKTQAVDAALGLLQQVTVQRAQAKRSRQERQQLEEERAGLRAAVRRRRTALDLAQLAYTSFVRAKNEEIQRIFDELRDDLARFYDVLHPGEGHSALSIEMDPRKRGSSDLKMGFYGRQEEDPRAFGSEGHLDSLGLCIFLAFVRRFNGDWPLLVLDDVVPAIDATHKQRVAALLFREFGDRQLFITTHDARWFNDLRRAQEESGHAATTKNLVIDSWSLEEGPQVRPAV
jgi:wobble nucleotide-excising tRNase